MSKMPGETLVALAPPLQFSSVSDGMNGIEMSGDQNPGMALFGMRKRARTQPAQTLSPAMPFD